MNSKEIIRIDTSRLTLREWKTTDLSVFAQMNADPDVMKFYPDTLSASASNAMAKRLIQLMENRGWGFWAVEEKQNQQFIGFTGLHVPDYDLPVSPCTEIGWRLAKTHWGQGYATEAAKAALSFAFTSLELPTIYSFTSTSNLKSRAVMERIGMLDSQQNFEHPIIPEHHSLREHVLYKIDKQQWAQRMKQHHH